MEKTRRMAVGALAFLGGWALIGLLVDLADPARNVVTFNAVGLVAPICLLVVVVTAVLELSTVRRKAVARRRFHKEQQESAQTG